MKIEFFIKRLKIYFIFFILCVFSLNCSKYKELLPVDTPARNKENDKLNESYIEDFGISFYDIASAVVFLKDFTPKSAMEVAKIYLQKYQNSSYRTITLECLEVELSGEDLKDPDIRKQKGNGKTIFIYPEKNMIISGASDFNVHYNTKFEDKLE